MTLVFDIETNGLLEETTKIHSLVIYDTNSQETYSCSNHSGYMPIDEGLKKLENAEEIAGHNIIKFDIPVIQKIYPSFNPKGKLFDTLLMSKLVYPDVGIMDDINIRKFKYPASVKQKNGKRKMIRGSYALFAWGYRLQEYKGDYCEEDDCWVEWSVDMQRYCEQDVVVTAKLLERIRKHDIPESTVELEHKFAQILFLQEQRGVYFDKEKAINLASKLIEDKARIERELKSAFPDEIKEETFIPKANNKTRGYIKGVPFTKKTVVEFNPSSRQMIANGLIRKYGWKPVKRSETGLPVIDEEVLETLDYTEAPLLKEYFLITKTLGQLADGKNAWLKMIAEDGAIHGHVDTIGAVTCRCTHNSPNLAQVPAVTMRVLYNLFDNYSKVNKKSYSRDIYFIRVLKRNFAESLKADLKLSDFEQFKTNLLEDGKSVSTVNKYLNILSKMYNLAISEGLLTKNPLQDVKKFHEKNYKIRYLTKDEETRLFSVVSKDFCYLKPIITCALQTGMRKSEILNLRWDNIDFEYKFIELLETKSGKARKIPISDTLMNVFNNLPRTSEYVFINKDTGEPFTDIHKSFTTVLDKAKIKKFRFHDLRHTVATRLVEKGIDLVVVKEILGHAKIETTMRYAHAVPQRKLDAISVLNSYC